MAWAFVTHSFSFNKIVTTYTLSCISMFGERCDRLSERFSKSGPCIFQLKSCQWFLSLKRGKFVKEANLVCFADLVFNTLLSQWGLFCFLCFLSKLAAGMAHFSCMYPAFYLLIMDLFDDHPVLSCHCCSPFNMQISRKGLQGETLLPRISIWLRRYFWCCPW